MINFKGVEYMADFEAKKAILEVAKVLMLKEYVVGFDGSISIRTGSNAVWITPSDSRLGFLTIDKLIKITLDGKFLTGSYKLYNYMNIQEELQYHLEVYKENQDVKSIIHAYPPNANLFSINKKNLCKMDFTKTISRLGEIPFVEDCKLTKDTVENCKGALVNKNGCIVWDKNIYNAINNLEAIEYVAKIQNSTTTKICNCGKNIDNIDKSIVSEQVNTTETKEEVNSFYLKGLTPLVTPNSVKSAQNNYDLEKAQLISEIVLQVTKKLKELNL